MDIKAAQQIAVFAAIFLIFQIGFDWMQGAAITPGLFLSRLVTTFVATVIYAVLVLWLKKRNEPEE